MKKPKVEWKDTSFIFSPKYKYSLFVRNRFVFFHAKSANVKKMINYANNFTCPNNICVIYVYGNIKEETVKHLIAKCKNQIMLLIIPGIEKSDFEIIDRYEKWLSSLKSQGRLEITKEGEKKSEYSNVIVGCEYGRKPSKAWFEEYAKYKQAIAENLIEPESIREYEVGISLISEYESVISKINKLTYNDFSVIANFITTEKLYGNSDKHSDELNNIAKQTFTYGVESDTDNEIAVKMALIKRLTAAAYSGDNSVEKTLGIKLSDTETQMSFWDDFSIGASEALQMLKNYMSDGIKNNGYFRIGDAWLIFSKPPFGAYSCNWYEYIFALAVKEYHNPNYCYGWGISSQRIRPIDAPFIKGGTVFAENGEQEKFKQMVIRLFDITRPTDTVQTAISYAISWVSDNIQYVPVHAIDERLKDLLFIHGGNVPNERFADCKDTYWYQYGYEKQFAFIEENFDYYYNALRQADAKFKSELIEKYGEHKANLYLKFYYVKNGAFSWLYTKSDLEERIKNYMEKEIICRECGNVFKFDYEAYEKLSDGKTEHFRFSVKDTIGLNKKFLGRYNNEFFCIPCLCEVLDISPRNLYEKLHEFKEAGCELF